MHSRKCIQWRREISKIENCPQSRSSFVKIKCNCTMASLTSWKVPFLTDAIRITVLNSTDSEMYVSHVLLGTHGFFLCSTNILVYQSRMSSSVRLSRESSCACVGSSFSKGRYTMTPWDIFQYNYYWRTFLTIRHNGTFPIWFKSNIYILLLKIRHSFEYHVV